MEFCNPLYYWFLGGSNFAGPLQDLVSQVQGLADVRRDPGIGGTGVTYIEVTGSNQNKTRRNMFVSKQHLFHLLEAQY